MKLRITTIAVLMAILALAVAPVGAAYAAPKTGTGTLTGNTVQLTDAAGNTINGVLNITRFVVEDGVIQAVGTITDAAGNVLANFTADVTDIFTTEGTCQILHLELGPIELDVLGLVVTTNEIVIDITAEAGSGNLLGNLLCSVAHLFDNPGNTLNAIVQKLNRILGLLG